MTDDLRAQVSRVLNLQDTEELLEIWQLNDRGGYTDEAFEVIAEILKSRGVELPPQDEPVYESDDLEASKQEKRLRMELRIVTDRNPPAFYDPSDVLKLSRWIDWATKAIIGLAVCMNILYLPSVRAIVESYFRNAPTPNLPLVYLITFVIVVGNIVVAIVLSVLVLKTLAQVLKILMEMEFNSRPKAP